MQNLQAEEMIVCRGLLCLILVLHHRQIACYIFPYLLSNFSLTVFCHENIHPPRSSSDSSPCHGQANDPHLRAHSYAYSSPFRRLLPHAVRGAATLSHGAAFLTPQFGAPVHRPPERLCSRVPASHSLVPPRLAGRNGRLIAGSELCGRTRGRGRFAPLQPWQHFPKTQPTVLASLPVFHGSPVSQRLRLPRNTRVAKPVSRSSVKCILPLYKTV